MTRPFFSLLSLSIFVWTMGRQAWIPSFRLFQDTAWDLSRWPGVLIVQALSLFAFLLTVLGLLGWSVLLQRSFFRGLDREQAPLVGFGSALCLFSLFVWGLAVNEVLYGALVAFPLAPVLPLGWREMSGVWPRIKPTPGRAAVLVVLCAIWGSEFLSSPILWDAVLDHFRFARETARLHQTLFHWTNHTGDMPKAAEMVLAGFWALGGETLSKLSLALPLALFLWTLKVWSREEGMREAPFLWIVLSCPFFLAIFGWGYVEGFLGTFEVLALYCLWRGQRGADRKRWWGSAAFFLGFAFTIKATALWAIGPAGVLFLWSILRGGTGRTGLWTFPALFIVPLVPWVLKNHLAFGDPFYPIGIPWGAGGVGYGTELEKGLLADTGLPSTVDIGRVLRTVGHCLFTTDNGVNAPWTPLWVMSLPWLGPVLRKKMGFFLALFSVLFMAQWVLLNQSLRHAAGGVLVLSFLASLAWGEAFKEKGRAARWTFALGAILSLGSTLCAQLDTTAPYAPAMGLEDPLLRLKRHYSFDLDTYTAYRDMERHSGPRDKIMAFAVFQTYPLERTAFVDFKWKRPIFFEWAGRRGTAEGLAKKLREEGVTYFLYQAREAVAMSHVEKDFDFQGMSTDEYSRFWSDLMEPVGIYGNSFVFRPRTSPRAGRAVPAPVPGAAEGLLEKKGRRP